jgi:diguanylate cyclase (GGDEF)-like protein
MAPPAATRSTMLNTNNVLTVHGAALPLLGSPDLTDALARAVDALARSEKALAHTASELAQTREELRRESVERKLAEETLAETMRGSRCIFWYAMVERDESEGKNGLVWDLHFSNEDVIKRWLPIEIGPGESFVLAWVKARASCDLVGMEELSAHALLNGLPGYSQEYRIQLADGQFMWFAEEVRVESTGPNRWHCTGMCTDITGQKRRDEQVELAEMYAHLEELAFHDGLTGLKNQRAFHARLAQEYQRAAQYHTPLSLIMLDVDRFKDYNDAFGHPAGDEVLRKAAGLLQENARERDFAARYGGEEFAVVIPADGNESRALAERFRAALEQATWPLRRITASFGISTFESTAVHPNTAALISEADTALYLSKTNGRNRVTHARDFMDTREEPLVDCAINAGGGALPGSPFAADVFYDGGSVQYNDDAVEIPVAAGDVPAALYRSARCGDFTYRIAGLKVSGLYLVRLHFMETQWRTPGGRVFSVAINAAVEAPALDIAAEAGGPNRALVKDFAATAGPDGTIAIALRGVKGLASLSGLELAPLAYRHSLSINCGGGDVWPYVSDRCFVDGLDVVQVLDAASHVFDLGTADGALVPTTVYRTERYGQFQYVIPDLPAGARCLVTLHFCESFWAKPGARIFDVAVNGSPVFRELDIFAETGRTHKPIAKKTIAAANTDGKIVIDFRPIVDNAQVTAIDVHW